LVNLIGNALKFTEKGGITIVVDNKQSDDNIIQLGFSITDTGIGIEPSKLSSIFDRFNQAEDSITRKYGGSGLGLSIVKDLVILTGDDISVEG
jgi:signal transduction histidine kinase